VVRARLLAMLVLLLAFDLAGLLTQPLLAPLLWSAIPLAVVGLWSAPPAKVGVAGQLAGGRKPRGGKRDEIRDRSPTTETDRRRPRSITGRSPAGCTSRSARASAGRRVPCRAKAGIPARWRCS
jgi:hypothetical protein